MKKLTLPLFILLFFHLAISAQPCLPYGITFTTQSQIDNFQTNYPNCTEIEGFVKICGDDITNLNGLNVLTSIGGYLDILGNDVLTSISGLENLTSIEGYLGIGANPTSGAGNISLASLSGLENISYIGGDLYFYFNNSLTSLSGLENLVSIGGLLRFEQNNGLTSLTGLDNLISIGGNIEIWTNESLNSLSGLTNLTSIGGGISISNNDALFSLIGNDNIEAASINDLHIVGNASLSTCDVQSICDYLVSPNGIVDIRHNASGCDNPQEIASLCGITLPCLSYGNYYFYSQGQIDSFQTDFPDCSELEGNVIINGDDITNLNGLNVVTSIGGDLIIDDNGFLNSLAGLENLTYIGGNLIIGINPMMGNGNPSLSSLTGLNNLTSIGGGLRIDQNNALTSLTGLESLTSIEGGSLLIGSGSTSWGTGGNPSLHNISALFNLSYINGNLEMIHNGLTNLLGLENLVSIGGNLHISDNLNLNSLAGLENIEASSINGIFITSNQSLSTCGVQSICDYLAAPGGTINIHDNAPGCNSLDEVEEVCDSVFVKEVIIANRFTISPNPVKLFASLEYNLHQPSQVTIKIIDIRGREVITLIDALQQHRIQSLKFDTSVLKPGIYFCTLKTNEGIQTKKIIKL